jgi:hypothetical protein
VIEALRIPSKDNPIVKEGISHPIEGMANQRSNLGSSPLKDTVTLEEDLLKETN